MWFCNARAGLLLWAGEGVGCGGDDESACVGPGLVFTAAALLFAVAIGAFVSSDIDFIKELGLGAALAVLIDATIVRAFLAPSLMKLLGDRNWWAPQPLRRVHQRWGPHETPADP